MPVYEQPALDHWPLQSWPAGLPAPIRAAREAATDLMRDNAQRLHTGEPDAASIDCILGTGHQAWLWHPGILAKDVRSWARARAIGRAAVAHIVVDHDVHAALNIELPFLSGDRLSVRRVALGDEKNDVPSGCQPPASGEAVARRVEALVSELRSALPGQVKAGLTRLAAAFREVEKQCVVRTLAEQITAVTWSLARGINGAWAADTGVIFGTQLHGLPCFTRLVESLLADAEWAVVRYNEATRLFPGAGIGELRIERERVELPLWWLEWECPRRRVFADLSDRVPLLVAEDGTELPWNIMPRSPGSGFLAPRALSLTALFRGWLCDGFVHGKGGGVYDRITEAWWRNWNGMSATGVSLAPMAVASADLRMRFDVPVATSDELTRADWRARWLPHNIDRALRSPDERKLALIAAMEKSGPDRRARRRRNAARFREVKQINQSLAARHGSLIDEAVRESQRAAAGVANRAVALKRDWFWALYDGNELAELETG